MNSIIRGIFLRILVILACLSLIPIVVFYRVLSHDSFAEAVAYAFLAFILSCAVYEFAEEVDDDAAFVKSCRT